MQINFYSQCVFSGCHQQDSTYGLPSRVVLEKQKNATATATQQERLVPLDDRVRNLEAVTLAFAAETNQSLSAVPGLINFAKVSKLSFLYWGGGGGGRRLVLVLGITEIGI